MAHLFSNLFRGLDFRIVCICVFSILISLNSTAQESQQKRSFEFGIETQAYLGGVIPGISFEIGIAEQEALNIRLGYNVVRHRSLGIHDNETGGGFGFTLGYRHYFNPNQTQFFLGARSDLWFNSVDWQDDINTPLMTSGTTEIIVLQPTIEAGYKFLLKNKHWTIAPTLAFGFEINVKSDGEDVGQGAIFLVGVLFNYRVK